MGTNRRLKGFGGWDAQYAGRTTRESLWGDSPIPVLEPALQALKRMGISTVVDLGCGDGRNLEALCAHGFACTGVDISPTALEQAAHRLRDKHVNVFFVIGSLSDLPFASGTVEAITAFDVFGQIIDSLGAIQEFHRVLAPGGSILLNAFSLEDSTFGEGIQLSNKIFEYKETIFKYFDRADIEELFSSGWDMLQVEKFSWVDDAHGDFRPLPHRHSSYFVVARKRGTNGDVK